LVYADEGDGGYIIFNRDRSCDQLAYLFTNEYDGAVLIGPAIIRMTNGLKLTVVVSEFSVEDIYRATVT
jgi:hypothetical protein